MKAHRRVYLPEASNNLAEPQQAEPPKEYRGEHPCPCCGCLTLPVPQEEAIAYICPVCYWENDVFLSDDEEPSDENHGMTLLQARENYRAFSACSKRFLTYVRAPKPTELPR